MKNLVDFINESSSKQHINKKFMDCVEQAIESTCGYGNYMSACKAYKFDKKMSEDVMKFISDCKEKGYIENYEDDDYKDL